MSRCFTRSVVRAAVCVSLLLVAIAAMSAGAAGASTLPTLSLALSKSSITVGGSTQSGAVNVVAHSTGLKESSAILFLLKPGVTVAEFEAAIKNGIGKDPNNTGRYGSIVFDAEVPPAQGSETQTVLQPGQYFALIPGEGKGPEAHTAFTVSAAKTPAALPAPQATIRSIEFGFRGPATLHDGEVVRFENEGFLVHMDVAFPVKSRSAATKVLKALRAGKEKGLEKFAAGAPFEFQGPVSHEAFQQVTITAKPGWYVQACFMDTEDGRSHTLLGMERIIKITK